MSPENILITVISITAVVLIVALAILLFESELEKIKKDKLNLKTSMEKNNAS